VLRHYQPSGPIELFRFEVTSVMSEVFPVNDLGNPSRICSRQQRDEVLRPKRPKHRPFRLFDSSKIPMNRALRPHPVQMHFTFYD
jgi:hypothetical protein